MLKTILKNKYKIIFGLIIIGGIFYYFFNQQNNQGKIETTTVKKETLSEELALSGNIDADEHVVLRFQSSGRLNWVGVKQGDTVKKYQTIASIDTRDVQKNLQKYLNSFSSERLDFDQNKYDNTNTINGLDKDAKEKAERALQKSQNTLNNSVLNVELQSIALEYASLWTPIEGIVTRVDSPNPGVNITPTTAEFEVLNPKTLYFSATVDQNDVIFLKENMNGTIVLDPYPEDEIKGTIKSISYTPKSGETGTVYEVKITLPINNSKYQLRYGMTGDISFTTKEKKGVLSLPSKFIKSEDGKKYVFLMKDNKKEKKYIKTGMETDNLVEIISGLSLKDKVSYE